MNWGRRTFGCLNITIILGVMLATPAGAHAQASDEQRRALIAKPSVVRVYGGYIGRYRLGNDEFPIEIGGSGSGFFVSSDGYIATNAHVIDAVRGDDAQAKRKLADSLRTLLSGRYNSYSVQELMYSVQLVELKRIAYVVLSNGDKFDYDVVASGVPGKGNDCAIIKIKIENAPAITIADSTGVLAADPITVIGYPGVADMRSVLDERSGLEATITSGTISALKRAESGEPILQISAMIAHGSSGGPAVDQNGQVIGLATFGAVDEQQQVNVQGFNFLVASSTLLSLIDQAKLTFKPSKTTMVWQQALSSYWSRDYEETITKLEEVQRLFPAHVDARNLLARAVQLNHDGTRHVGASKTVATAKWLALAGGAIVVLVALLLFAVRKRRGSTSEQENTRTPLFVHAVGLRHRPRKPQALVVDDESAPSAHVAPAFGEWREADDFRNPGASSSPKSGSLVRALLIGLAILALLGGVSGLRLWRERSSTAARSEVAPASTANTVADLRTVSAQGGVPTESTAKPSKLARPATARPIVTPTAIKTVVTVVTVSSTHTPGAGYSFDASNLVDTNLATSWQPRNSREPAWIRLSFKSDIEVTSIKIANGFQTFDSIGDEFVLNSRIAKARIRFSDDTEIPIQFAADARGFVKFEVPTKLTHSATVIVDDVHHGSRWNDLAVSEIEVDTLKTDAGISSSLEPPPNSPPIQSTKTLAKIMCRDWFRMSDSEQAKATRDVGAQVRADYQRKHGRTVEEFRAGDYVAFADAFTALCKSGGTEDMYTVGMATAETAFANP